jgi:hypothetical protein
VLKRFIKQAQLDVQGPQLQNEKQVVALLKAKLSGRPKKSYLNLQEGLSNTFFFM